MAAEVADAGLSSQPDQPGQLCQPRQPEPLSRPHPQSRLYLSTPEQSRLLVSEIFGPTIQGEGPCMGRSCSFIRLGGCNLSCSWCDSAYAWDSRRYDLKQELSQLDADEILRRTPAAALCIITGGEPLVQQRASAFLQLLSGLSARRQQVHIETNGSICPTQDCARQVALFVVSPKLDHAQAGYSPGQQRLHPGWAGLARAGKAHLKIVVQSQADVEAALQLAGANAWDRRQVWLMPQGSTRAQMDVLWPQVCAWAAEAGVNASHRLHILAWGDKRGH